MSSNGKPGMKGVLVMLTAVTISILVATPMVSGDILGQGVFKLSQTVVPPPVIEPPGNVTYHASTFEWNYTMVNNTMTGTLRVHVNFNQTTNSEFWNVLEMVNPGNITGNFTVRIVQYAKMGSNYYLNDTYTQNVSVYISHTWQTNSSPGTRLYNNTSEGPFQLYPSNEVSYYIGIIYTVPTYPPETSNYNSFGEYVDFYFQIIL